MAVRYLLQHGAGIKTRDRYGGDALSHSLLYPRVTLMLLDAKSERNLLEHRRRPVRLFRGRAI